MAGATSCPACDAPAPPRSRSCASCGYSFVEDEDSARVRTRPLATLAGGLVAATLLVLLLTMALGSDEEPAPARSAPMTPGVAQVVSSHPLTEHGAESALADLFVAEQDQESSQVICSEREARPAHSVRRCEIRYPNGATRDVVLLTNARGDEVLIER